MSNIDCREFHVGDVISITTGKLWSPRLIEGVYDILNFLTGENLFTHQLPRAADAMMPCLQEQFPELFDLSDEEIQEVLKKHGDVPVMVHKPKKAVYEYMNPVKEIIKMKEEASAKRAKSRKEERELVLALKPLLT